MERRILDTIYLKRKPKIQNTKNEKATIAYPNCFDKVITECVEIKNKQCQCLNRTRQKENTITETIEVGLELPNSNGQLIRFIPRYITIVTYNG